MRGGGGGREPEREGGKRLNMRDREGVRERYPICEGGGGGLDMREGGWGRGGDSILKREGEEILNMIGGVGEGGTQDEKGGRREDRYEKWGGGGGNAQFERVLGWGGEILDVRERGERPERLDMKERGGADGGVGKTRY